MSASRHGSFYWNELMTGDVEKAKAFFASTVGWTYDAMSMGPDGGTYWVAKANGNPVAGIMAMQGVIPDGIPPHWMSYLAVDDIEARLLKVEAAGGKIMRAVFEVPNIGKIAIVSDASGAVMGWITPAQQAADNRL